MALCPKAPQLESWALNWEQGQEAFLDPVLQPHQHQPSHTGSSNTCASQGAGWWLRRRGSLGRLPPELRTPSWELPHQVGLLFVSHTFQPDHRSLWKKGKALKILAGTERGKKRGCVFLFNFLLSSPFFSHLDRMNSIAVLHRGGWMSRVETQRLNIHIPSFKIWSMLQGSPGVCGVHGEQPWVRGESGLWGWRWIWAPAQLFQLWPGKLHHVYAIVSVKGNNSPLTGRVVVGIWWVKFMKGT